MKTARLIKFFLIMSVLNSSLLVAGCVSRESVITREISEEGPNSVENSVIKERRTPNGRRIIEKEVVTETIRCVGKDGFLISAKSVQECIKKKGRVIDEVVVEQEKIRRR
jgi:hypothetical protein